MPLTEAQRAPVAQMDRARSFYLLGRGFESLRARQAAAVIASVGGGAPVLLLVDRDAVLRARLARGAVRYRLRRDRPRFRDRASGRSGPVVATANNLDANTARSTRGAANTRNGRGEDHLPRPSRSGRAAACRPQMEYSQLSRPSPAMVRSTSALSASAPCFSARIAAAARVAASAAIARTSAIAVRSAAAILSSAIC